MLTAEESLKLLLSHKYLENILIILRTIKRDNYIDLINDQITSLYQYIVSQSTFNKSNLTSICLLFTKIRFLLAITKIPGYTKIDHIIDDFNKQISFQLKKMSI